jgi:hypothetical protein
MKENLMPSETESRIVGIFEHTDRAVEAIQALATNDFPPEQIIGIARAWRGVELPGPRVDLQNAASRGALVGTIGGAAGGLLLGVAAGALVTILTDFGIAAVVLAILCTVAAGATIGCYLGPFIALEMTEREAKLHEREIEQGRAIVVVRTADRRLEARAIMVSHGAYDFSTTADLQTS